MAMASQDELAMGSLVRYEHSDKRSTVGPFVRIKDTRGLCYLTSWHKFKRDTHQNNDIYVGEKFVRVPRYMKQTCGEIIAIQLDDRVDAVLVKLSGDFVPKCCRFANVKEGQLEDLGLDLQDYQSSYDIGAIDPTHKTFHEQDSLTVIKFGATSGVTKGKLLVEEGKVHKMDFSFRDMNKALITFQKHYKVIPVKQCPIFCEDDDIGAAVFIIDKKFHLHCIGMVIRSMEDGSALVTPIHTILKCLGRKIGRTLEMATFLDDKNELFLNSGFDQQDKHQFELALKDGKEMDNFVRLMIVGQYNQGKTSLTNRLLGMPVEKTESTHGIEVHIKMGKIVGDQWVNNLSIEEEAAIRLLDAKIDRNAGTQRSSEPGNPNDVESSENTEDESHMDAVSFQNQKTSEYDNKVDLSTSPEVQRLRQNYADVKNEGLHLSEDEWYLHVNIWDFGGQSIYYATHQIFHSNDAVYILVFNLMQDLHEKVVNEDFPDMRYEMTMKDHLKFWVYSIHSFVGSNDGKEPTIILVGTHKKELSDDEINNKFYEILDMFSGKPAREHIYQEQFAVDNSDPDDENIKKLKRAIYDIGLIKANNRQLPTKWILLEMKMESEKDRHILTFEELLQVFNKEKQVTNAIEMKSFLKYQNSKGNIVYFDEEDLKEYVVVDPQFLVDAFKCILQSKAHCKWNAELQPLWNELMETAVLKNTLIEGVWKEDKFCSKIPILLKFLKRHKILAEILKFDDDEKKYSPTGKFMVPSLLKNNCDKKLLVSFLEGKTTTACSLRFVFDDMAVLRILYERVLAALLAIWPPVQFKKQKMVFRDLGLYRLNNQCTGMIRLKEDEGLDLTVISQCTGNTPVSDACDEFRRCVECALQHEFKGNRNNARDKSYKHQISCSHPYHDGKGSCKAHELEDVKREKRVSCPDYEAHGIEVPIAINEWFKKSRVTLTSEHIMRPPTEKDLSMIAESIGENWILFGIEQLDLSSATIERIKMDHSSNGTKTMILYMLIEWQRSSPDVSLSSLIEKMRSCENLSVDWDKVYGLLQL